MPRRQHRPTVQVPFFRWAGKELTSFKAGGRKPASVRCLGDSYGCSASAQFAMESVLNSQPDSKVGRGEPSLPQSVTEDRDARSLGLMLFSRKRSTATRSQSQQGEQVAGNNLTGVFPRPQRLRSAHRSAVYMRRCLPKLRFDCATLESRPVKWDSEPSRAKDFSSR